MAEAVQQLTRKRLRVGGALAAFLCFGAFANSMAQAENRTTIPAAQFVGSVGVNVHMEYTDGKYADVGAVLKDLEYLGIESVRDSVPRPTKWMPPGQGVAAIDRLAKTGIRFDITVGADTNVEDDMTQLQELELKHPGMLLAVEGPNEINNWPVKTPGMTSEQAAQQFQRALYIAVHKEPLLHDVAVYYFTGGSKIDLRAQTGLADVANGHPYPHNGDQPSGWLHREYQDHFAMGPGFPYAATETGYYTLPNSRDWGGVDLPTQAKLMLNLLLDAAEQGNVHTYIYQLLDPYPDPQGKNVDAACGLFLLNNDPKPSAVAIHNLFRELRDEASQPRMVGVAVQGLPAQTGHSLVLSKANGTVAVAVWNEVPLWDAQAQHALTPAPVNVSIAMDGPESATIYDPLTGKEQTVKRSSEGAYPVTISDHAVLLMVPSAAK